MVRFNFLGFVTLTAFLFGCSDDKFAKLASPVFLQNGSTTTTTLPDHLTTTTTRPNTTTTIVRNTTSTIVHVTSTTKPPYESTTTRPLTTTTTLVRTDGDSLLRFNRICRTAERPYYENLQNPELRVHMITPKEGSTRTLTIYEAGKLRPDSDNNLPYTDYERDDLLFTQVLPSPIMPADYSLLIPKAVRDVVQANPTNFFLLRVCAANVPKNGLTDSKECLSGQNFVFTTATFVDGLVLPLHHARNKIGGDFCDTNMGSPLILDLDDDGIDLIGADPGVAFDLLGSGQKIDSGWTSKHRDAFLALDLNHNGLIDSGIELFGNNTLLGDGKKAANGFEALKQYDQNRDGVINPRDKAYHSLILWMDANQDGISQREEMRTMAQENVETIDLDYIHIDERDVHGNETRQRSAFKKFGDVKRIRRIVDIWFVMN